MKIMRERMAPTLVLFAVFLRPAGAAPPMRAEPLPDADRQLDRRIDEAIKSGVDYLLTQRKKGRAPGDNPTLSAHLLYTLLELGHHVDDPRLRANAPELAGAVEALLAERPESALEASFKALALGRMRLTPEVKAAAIQTRDVLLTFIRSDASISARAGANTLNTAQSQWAYEALAALEDAGVEIDPALWKTADQWWRSNQLKDGGWPDIRVLPNSNPTATAAGLGSLYLTASRLAALPEAAAKEPPKDAPIDLGLKKLLADFNPRSTDYFFLYLWQRAASAGGIAPADAADWYKATAEEMLQAQRPGGSWQGPNASNLSADADATAFALLFLARGRDPVIFNKLDYPGPPSHCNDRPRDDANLTHWLAHELDKPLNWQAVSLQSSPARWGNAPILLITGSGDPNFTAEDMQRLRAYVHAGGLIFSTADGGDPVFTNAIVKKYAPQLAENRYEMRPLPQSHELFGGDLYAKISSPLALVGLSNGVREWWVHSPVDMGASWQGRRFEAREHFELPANLLRYATGNGSLRDRLQGLPRPPETPVHTLRTIHLARLEYAGNSDPEPAAWPRLATLAPPTFHSLLEITRVKAAELDPAKTPVAHMTGTSSFTLTDPEIAALKKFLDAGGTLLADSAGASPRFTASFLQLMAQLYPDIPPVDLAVNDPVFNGSLPDSVRLSEVEYRKYAILKMKERQIKPHLQAITLNARHVILFSPEDLTSGLLGTQTWGIRGYTPESAENLARNLLLYSAVK